MKPPEPDVTALAIRHTTIGKKIIMAVSGLVLFGFTIVHMLGNMQIFIGPEAINGYHVKLYSMPTFLWAVRGVLIVAVAAHILSAMALVATNRAARPARYHHVEHIATSYAARTMAVSGLLLLFYIIYHVAHTVGGVTAGLGYQHDHVDVYANLVQTYQHPWAVALNVAAALVFGTHVYHGAWSLFQTLGLNHKRHNGPLRQTAIAVALVVTLGFFSVPLAVAAGVVGAL